MRRSSLLRSVAELILRSMGQTGWPRLERPQVEELTDASLATVRAVDGRGNERVEMEMEDRAVTGSD